MIIKLNENHFHHGNACIGTTKQKYFTAINQNEIPENAHFYVRNVDENEIELGIISFYETQDNAVNDSFVINRLWATNNC